LACAVHGVDADIRQIADEFAAAGYIAAAPDLFWRTVPGPLGHDDKALSRTFAAAAGEESRPEKRDLSPTRGASSARWRVQRPRRNLGVLLRRTLRHPRPEAARLDAGICCHATQMLDISTSFDGVTQPVCIIWGDQDHRAPPEVLDAYRPVHRA